MDHAEHAEHAQVIAYCTVLYRYLLHFNTLYCQVGSSSLKRLLVSARGEAVATCIIKYATWYRMISHEEETKDDMSIYVSPRDMIYRVDDIDTQWYTMIYNESVMIYDDIWWYLVSKIAYSCIDLSKITPIPKISAGTSCKSCATDDPLAKWLQIHCLASRGA